MDIDVWEFEPKLESPITDEKKQPEHPRVDLFPGDLVGFDVHHKNTPFYDRALGPTRIGNWDIDKELALVLGASNERYGAGKRRMMLVMTTSGRIGWVSEHVLRKVEDSDVQEE